MKKKQPSTSEVRPARIYFSDFFGVSPKLLESYGAFNVSPVVDLPLFVDPFLLFTSDKQEYKALHEDIIKYLKFLRDKSAGGQVSTGLLKAWFCFHEVHQNCLGFCLNGNKGAGLGLGFAKALNSNLHNLFRDFGEEQVTKSSHLEKLMLIRERVGKDNISDFTTNLIKGFLLHYTEEFAKKHIDPAKLKEVAVSHASFDFEIGAWRSAKFTLPWLGDDYVLLTPEDVLTKDDTWINKEDLRQEFPRIRDSLDNDALRAQVDQYFSSLLKKDATAKDERAAIEKTIRKFPQIIDHFIRSKEDRGNEAIRRSRLKVDEVESRFVKNLSYLAQIIADNTEFYNTPETTLDECKRKIDWLKHVIENQDGYRLFYDNSGLPIKREKDLQIAFKLVWHGSPSSVDAEVNNGRGPVDFKISRGSSDSTLVEFKLASNTQLERNLEKQVEIYKAANNTKSSFKVVLFFDDSEERRVKDAMKSLNATEDTGIVLIDARRDNKPSASKA
jgi:hypothetical protein